MSAAAHGGALDEESYARAALTYLAEPADRWLNGLISAHGAARTLEAIRSGRLPEPSGDFPMPRPLQADAAALHGALAGAPGRAADAG